MNDMNNISQSEDNEKRLSFIHAFLVTSMLTLFTYSMVQVGEYVVPAWDGTYLVIIGGIIAIEAQYSYRLFVKKGFNREQLFYRITEWVFIIVLLKIVNYSLRGFDTFFNDMIGWRENFIYSFFSGEYLISLLVTGAIWGLATFFSVKLYQLEGDEELLDLERNSSIAVHRKEVREGLAIGILFVGIVMVGSVAFIFLTRRTSTFGTSDVPLGIVPLVFYFAFGLALLSITQFSILRVHWVVEKIPFRSNLITQWLIYSLGLLLLVGIVAMLLPTNYSIGLLEFFNTLLSMLLWALWVIAFILTLPIALLLSLLFRFRGGEEGTFPTMERFLPDPPQQTGPAAGWVEWVKTLLFWLFFVGIILFSVIYFLRQNRQLMDRLRRFRLVQAIRMLFYRLKTFLSGANNSIRIVVQKQIKRIQARRTNRTGRQFGFINPRRLDARQQILYYYMAMIRRGQESGLPRHPDQTPDEYFDYLQHHLPEEESSIAKLTDNFKEARYTLHLITKEQASTSYKAWDTIKRKLREFTRKKDGI